MKSALEFAKVLGLGEYAPGTTGETVTLDDLDEFDVSVGDVYKFGTVLCEASYPRIPCGKVNFRMQNERGQKAMQECGRSGVYFRILEPGKIAMGDEVRRVDQAQHRLLISDVYRLVVKGEKPSPDIVEIARKNGALPKRQLEKWSAT
jgi:MOSC domain-containing protein YiiM